MGKKEPTVTTMILKVDLGCQKCYKKVKKVLCKFPQIRDQVFDAKQNKVEIKVVCCDPEKLRDKLCRKGCGSIKSIGIVEPKENKPPGTGKPGPDTGNRKTDTKEPQKDKEESKGPKPGPGEQKPSSDIPSANPGRPVWPAGTCCRECYEGVPGGPCYRVPGGPCYHGCGVQIIQYGGYWGRPVHDSWGCGCGYSHGCYVRPCDCIIEQNPSACTMM